ncbi:glycosyltransferase [Vibrio breoganii]
MSDHKVVILQNSLKTTNIFRYSYIKNLIDKGKQVVVIAPNDCDESKRLFETIGVKVKNIPSGDGKVNLLRSVIFMNYYILNYRIQNSVFVCHFVSTFVQTYFTLVPFNRKLLVSIEGLGSLFSKSKFPRLLLKTMLSSSNIIRLFCNNNEKELVGKEYDVVTNGIGIDLSNFCHSDEKDFGKHTRLLYVGRLIEDKGILVAISTLRYLLKKGHNVKLCVVGDIYQNNPTSLSLKDIEDYKAEFGASIEFVGFSSRVLDWYRNSDILLLPSVREGFPVCVMEANAVGIPAICYDVPGCRDAIIDGMNGFLVEPFDVNQYHAVVESCLSDELLIKLFYTSSKYARKNFDSKVKDNQFIKIIYGLYER